VIINRHKHRQTLSLEANRATVAVGPQTSVAEVVGEATGAH
jgi:hypothetical protein